MNYRFSELVEIEKVQSLMDSYCQAIGIASAIIDLDGNVLIGTNWQPLCTDFHRVNEQTCQMCIESDTVLANRLQEGEKYTFYECRNGLIDAATPIIIDGEHVANLFIGQFLVGPPDADYFRRQALQYGFDQTAYLDALAQVPIISREKVTEALNFVAEFAVMLGEMGLRQKQQLERAQKMEHEISRRKRIEEELRKLLRAVEQSANTIVITDTEGYIEYVNPKFTETTGYSREEAIGQHTRILKSGAMPSEAYRDLWETITAGREWRGEFQNKKKNGELYWEFASISPIKDENDHITNFLAVKEDITERKQSETALQESERRLADIIDFLPDPVFVIDRGGRVMAWNRAIEEMTGATAEEMLGQGNYEYALPFYGERRPLLIDLVFEPHEEVEAKYDFIKRKGDSLFAETLVPLKGADRYLVGHAAALYDSQGNIVGAIETVRDITEEKAVQESLRDSEARYSAVVEQANDGVVIIQDGVCLFVNEALAGMLGYRPEEIENTSFVEYVAPESRELVAGRVKARLAGEDVSSVYEARLLRKDGSSFEAELSAGVIEYRGQIADVGVIRNITERKRAEEAIRASEQRYRELYLSIRDGVASIDMEGNIVECNAAFEQMVGYSFDELQKITFLDLTPEKWHAMEAKILEEQVLTQGYSDLYQKEYIKKDGTIFPVELSVYLTRDEQGNPAGFWGFIRDITERRQAEEVRLRLQSAVEQTAEGIAIADLEGNLLFANLAWAEMHGYRPEEIEGVHLSFFHTEEQLQNDVAPFNQQAMESGSHQGEVGHVTKDGLIFPTMMSSTLLKDENGNPVGLVATVRDITEQKRIQEAIRQSQQRLSLMVQRTPLAVIEWTPNFEVVDWNPAAEKIFGYSKEEALGRHVAGLIVPEEIKEAIPEAMQEVLKEQGAGRNNENITKDGRTIVVEWYNTPLINEAGEVMGVTSLAQDITERVKLEQEIKEALKRRESQVALSTEVAQDIAAAPALDELFRQVVELVQERFDYYHAHVYTLEEEDLVMQEGTGEAGRQMKAAGHKIALAAEQSLVARAARSGEPVLVPDVSKEPGWLPNRLLPDTRSEIAVPIKLGDRVLGVLDVQDEEVGSLGEEDQLLLLGLCGQIAVAIDNRQAEIERRQVQEALQESEHRFRSLVSNIPGTIYRCALDANWTMEFMTGPIEEMSGYPISDFIGNRVRAYASIIHPEDTTMVDQKVQEAVAEKRPFALEYRIIGADGQIKWVYEGGQAAYGEDGEPLWLDGAIFDITERKQAEAELEARLHELGALQRLMSREGWQEFQTVREQTTPGYLFDQTALRPVTWDELNIPAGNGQSEPDSSESKEKATPPQVTTPLAVSGERIGTLGIYDDPDHPLTAEEREFLEAVSTQVAEALERARLLEQSQTALAETEGLYNVTQRLNEAGDLQELITVVAESDLLPHLNRILLYGFQYGDDGRGESVTAEANWSSGEGVPPTAVGTEYLWPMFAKFGLLLSGAPRFSNDILLDEEIDPASAALLRRSKTRAVAVLPLWSGSRQVGALLLESEEPHRFSEREMRTCAALARQVAVAVENRRLFEETRQALAEVESTQRRYTVQAWEAYRDRQMVKLYEQVREGLAPLGDLLPPEVGRAVTQKKPLAVSAPPAVPAHEDSDPSPSSGNGASLVVPLTVRNEIIGVLGLQDTDERDWTPEEIALVEAIGEQLGQAAEQLRLFDESQQRAARERRVNEISDKIQAAQSLEEALKIAAKEVGLSLQAPQTMVQLDIKNENK